MDIIHMRISPNMKQQQQPRHSDTVNPTWTLTPPNCIRKRWMQRRGNATCVSYPFSKNLFLQSPLLKTKETLIFWVSTLKINYIKVLNFKNIAHIPSPPPNFYPLNFSSIELKTHLLIQRPLHTLNNQTVSYNSQIPLSFFVGFSDSYVKVKLTPNIVDIDQLNSL